MSHHTKTLFFFLMAGFFLWGGCAEERTPASIQKEKNEGSAIPLAPGARAVANLKTEITQYRPYSAVVKTSGVVTFNKKKFACVTARVPGRIEELYAFEGDRVGARQNLLELYSNDFLSAEQEFLQLAAQRERAEAAGDKEASLVVERLLQSVGQKLRLMGAEDEDIRKLRDSKSLQFLFVVRAPFAGTVVASSATIGAYVETGAELFELADLEILWVMASIFEKDLSLIKPGSTAEVRVQAWPGEVFGGRLTLLGDVEDEATRTVKGRIEIPNPQRKLKPGMYADVSLISPAREKVLAVPESAVREAEGRQVVFVPGPGNAYQPRIIKTGRRFDGWVEILEGLREGEEVVTKGSFALKAEMLKKTLEGEE